MKNLFKSSMLVAIVAAALVGCSKDTTETNAPVVKGTTVHFKAEVADDTDGSRASLTPSDDDKLFTAAWENTDSIGIYATDGSNTDSNAKGKYDSDDKAFSATFTNCKTPSNKWSYYAYYPYVDTVDAKNYVTVPFGSARTQKGNAYNSAYDIMAADEFAYKEGSATTYPGKDDKGNSIVFAMHRLTAIAYFHFKTEVETVKDEEVVSVTLTVDEGKAIADNVGAMFCFTDAEKAIIGTTGETNTITITYEEGNRPTASDFTAWFNVLPVDGLSNLTIDIKTTNHTAQFTRKSDVGAISYAAGKLYKVSTSIAKGKWTAKAPDYSDTYLITEPTGDGQNWYMSSELESTKKPRLKAIKITSPTFDDAKDEYAWVIEKSDDKYTIQSYTNRKYVAFVSSQNYANLVDDIASAAKVSITKDEEKGTLTITSITETETRYLCRNNTATNCYFAFYKNSQTGKGLTFIPYSAKERLAQPTVEATADDEGNIAVTWSAVENADNYTVTCGSNTQTITTTSHTFAINTAGTHTVSVVANPSDTETYRSSNAGEATATILANPTNINRTTMNAGQLVFTWGSVTNATEYAWAIYEGETEIDHGTATETTTVTYDAPAESLLKAKTTYTLKVKTKATGEYGALKEPATATCSYSPAIAVNKTSISLNTPSEANGTITVTLTDLVAEKVTVNTDEFITDATLDGTTLSYTVLRNEGEERTGNITLSAPDADSVTIAVTQATCYIKNPTITSPSLTTAKLQAKWNKVTNATSYKWRLTTADGTPVENGSGTASNPASGDVVSLSENVSTLGLTEGNQYVLYVKSVPATDYAVQGEESKTDVLTCEAAGGEVVKGSTWQSLTFNSTAGSNAALFTTTGNTIDFSGSDYGAMNWKLTQTGTGTLGSDATRGVQLQQNAAVKMETTGYSGGVESITLGLSKSSNGNNTPTTLTVTVDGHTFTGTISCTTSVTAFTLTCTDGIIDATSKTISIEIGTNKSSTYISYIKIN